MKILFLHFIFKLIRNNGAACFPWNSSLQIKVNISENRVKVFFKSCLFSIVFKGTCSVNNFWWIRSVPQNCPHWPSKQSITAFLLWLFYLLAWQISYAFMLCIERMPLILEISRKVFYYSLTMQWFFRIFQYRRGKGQRKEERRHSFEKTFYWNLPYLEENTHIHTCIHTMPYSP